MDTTVLAIAKKYTRDIISEALVNQVDMGDYATIDYVDSKVAELVDTAPEVLDTLNELAAALGDDADYAATITTQLSNKVDKTTTVNNKPLSSNISLGASDVGAVPTSRTVNGKALSGNITLSATDVKALPDTTTIPTTLASLTEDATHRVVTDAEKIAWNAKSNFSGSYNDLTNKPTIPSVDGLATTTYVDNAVANKEFILNSTTEGSTKKFRIAVDDSGTLTAVEITE